MRKLGVDQTNNAKICAVFHPPNRFLNVLVVVLQKRNPGLFTYFLGFVCSGVFFFKVLPVYRYFCQW